jgi:hypothetical protein
VVACTIRKSKGQYKEQPAADLVWVEPGKYRKADSFGYAIRYKVADKGELAVIQ